MIDVNKPMQFKGSFFRAHFEINQVFKSVNPQRFIVEYSDRYSLEDSQVGMFNADGLENIPEPKPLTWTEAMIALSEGKKVQIKGIPGQQPVSLEMLKTCQEIRIEGWAITAEWEIAK